MPISLSQYVGAKGLQLGSLLPLIPQTHTYVEPFAGCGVVLMNRRRSEVEVVNDLNGWLVNLYRVFRDPDQFTELHRRLEWTPFARAEFNAAVDIYTGAVEAHDDVTRAWAMFVLLNQGISGKLHRSYGNWSRSMQDSKNTERWANRIALMPQVHERLKYVQIECRDAIEVMQVFDGPDTTFYIDPPYIHDTRDSPRYYLHEMADTEHKEMVEVLLELKGSVVLSGYLHPIYEPLSEAGWMVDYYSQSVAMSVGSEDKAGRVEVVWRNPPAADLSMQRPLFVT